jgi:hypothetical protein
VIAFAARRARSAEIRALNKIVAHSHLNGTDGVLRSMPIPSSSQ